MNAGQQNTWPSATHKFRIVNTEAYLTIAVGETGQPVVLTLKIAKTGSTIAGFADAWLGAENDAIARGMTVAQFVARNKGKRFEPLGDTSNPDIPVADSLPDYIAKFLELAFADGQPALPIGGKE